MNTKLKTFIDSLLAINPIHVNRKTDACDWVTPDGIEVFHERSYWGYPIRQPEDPVDTPVKRNYRLLKMATTEFNSHYWGAVVYKDLSLAKTHAKQYRAVVEMCFYCDENDPAWFLIFNDFDKAAEYSMDMIEQHKLDKPDKPATSIA